MNASAPSPSPNPSPADPEAARQKGAARAPRIPVKVIPAGEPLREPDWIACDRPPTRCASPASRRSCAGTA